MESLGASLVGVSPQLGIHNQALTAEKKLSFELLSDPGNRVADSFGLVYSMPEDLKALYLQFGLDVAAHNGDDSWRLPIPARYIVDRSRRIVYAQANIDHTVRAEPEATLEALRAMA